MTDEELVNAYLERVKGMSLRRAGALISTSHTTVGRWRNGDFEELDTDTRLSIQRFLAAPEDRGLAYADGYGAAIKDVEGFVAEMADNLDQLRRLAAEKRRR